VKVSAGASAWIRRQRSMRTGICSSGLYSSGWLTDTALSCAPPVEGNDTSGGRPANRPPNRAADGWRTWQVDQAAARQLQRLVSQHGSRGRRCEREPRTARRRGREPEPME
jgi:hypothetical protein